MANPIDNAFSIDDISINDKVVIFGGDQDPIVTQEVAPTGSIFLRTTGDLYIKTGVNDFDWTILSNKDDKAKISATDSTTGYLFDKIITSLYLNTNKINAGGNEQLTIDLSNSGVTPGTYKSVVVDVKGRITAGTNPSTLSGYGITDAQPLAANLSSLSNNSTLGYLVQSSTGTIVARSLSSTTLTLVNPSGTAGNTTIDLANVGTPVSNTFVKITTDAQGRVSATSAVTATDLTTTLGYTPVNRAGDTMTGLLTLSGNPTANLHAATKQYVDNLITGLDFKQSVKVATTANITLSGTQTIDGVAVVAGDRVLVKNQTTSSANGIYVVATGAWTRATDADNSGSTSEVTTGMYCFIEQGTVNASTGWLLSTTGTITLGTTGLTFAQFTGVGALVAGNGLTKTGNQIDAVSSTGTLNISADSIDLATSGVTIGTYNNITVDTYGRVTSGSNISYLTSNQNITLTGDATGSGTTSIPVTLANIVTAGIGTKISFNSKGLVTAATTLSQVDIPSLDWSKITTGLPTTLAGYGITNGVINLGNSNSIQSNTFANRPTAPTFGSGFYYSTDTNSIFYSDANNWSLISPAYTGDATSLAGNTVLTLSNTGVIANTYNNVTVDTKGRVTSGSNVSYLTAIPNFSFHGDISSTINTSTDYTFTLNNINSNVGSFGNSTNVGQFTVNGKGLITAASNIAIAFPVTSVAGRTGAITLTSTDVGLSNVTNSLQVINSGNFNSISSGLLSARPSAGTANRFYVSTDTFSLFRDNGSSWDLISPAFTGDVTTNAGTTTLSLPNVGTPVSNSFVKITTDTKGRISATSAVTSSDLITTLGYTPVNKAGDTMTGLLTLSGDPTSALHAATKQYVDNAITGLDFKQSVRVATTANITLTGTQVIDGVTVAVGDRVLVKNQTTASANGIYVVSGGAWSRATDVDNTGNTSEVTSGMFCYVEQGSTNGATAWVLSTTGTITLGTTNLVFTQFNGTAGYIGGAGLTLTGSTFDIGTASTSRIVVNADNIDLATTGVTAGTYNNITVDAYGRATSGSNVAYITGNQTITLSGDISGSGTTSISTTLANSGVIAGTYNTVTVNSKGIVTSASTAGYITGNQTITITGDATGSGTTSIPLVLNTVPISKGGTGQTTALAAINALSPLTSKGDILAHTGANNVRQPAGTQGYFLMSDNTSVTGLSYQPVVTTDKNVRTSATDTTSGFLIDKLVAGTGISLVINNSGANETLTINNTITSSDQAVFEITNTNTNSITTTYTSMTWYSVVVNNSATTYSWTSGSNITILQAGYYQFSYSLPVASRGAARTINAQITKNGTVVTGSITTGTFASNTTDCMTLTIPIQCAANDVIAVQMKTSTGTDTLSTGANLTIVKLTGAIGPQGPQGIQGLDGPTGPTGPQGVAGPAGPAGAGSSINIQDEGTTLLSGPFTMLNFTGGLVTASNAGSGTATVNVTGPISALTDTNISAPSDGQLMIYDGTLGKWKNATLSALNPIGKTYTLDFGAQNNAGVNIFLGCDDVIVPSNITPHIIPWDSQLLGITFTNGVNTAGCDIEVHVAPWGTTTTSTVLTVPLRNGRAFRKTTFTTPITFNAGDMVAIYMRGVTGQTSPSRCFCLLHMMVTANTLADVQVDFTGNIA